MHKSFHDALLNADARLPTGLTSYNHTDCKRRFAVYRNNVVVALIDALASNFVVVQHLVGEVFFRAMAREFASQHPPSTPLMAFYGARFADFIATFPPAATVVYLADMARLEYAIQISRHSADSRPIAPDKLSHLIEDQQALNYTGLKLATAVQVLSSAFPVVSIWHAHQGSAPFDLSQIQLSQPESVMLSRPELNVELHSIDAGAAEFICNLTAAQPLAEAAQTTVPFNPTAVLQLLIQQQAISELRVCPKTASKEHHYENLD